MSTGDRVMRAAIAACLLNPQCPDCGRPRSPVDRCDPDSIDDDGECPYLTIERLRAELARRVSPAVAPVPGDMKTMDDCPFSAQIDQHRFATAVIDDHPKREFVPAGDYVPLETKYGPVMVLPTDGEHGPLVRAGEAVGAAIGDLAECAPHGRDYYVQGDDAYAKARDEHLSRIARLQSVLDEIKVLARQVQKAQDAKSAR